MLEWQQSLYVDHQKEEDNTMAWEEPKFQILRIWGSGPSFHIHLSIIVKSLNYFRLQVPHLQSKNSYIHL